MTKAQLLPNKSLANCSKIIDDLFSFDLQHTCPKPDTFAHCLVFKLNVFKLKSFQYICSRYSATKHLHVLYLFEGASITIFYIVSVMNRVIKLFGSSSASIIFILFAIVLLVTAVNSKGFYHWDEHYQILESASYKMGITPQKDLPWEYSAQIRSGFQPFIAFSVIKVMAKIGINSPFLQCMALRFLSACVSLCTSIIVFLYLRFRYKNLSAHILALLSTTIWFIPFIGVRFSSEAWSAAFMAIGAVLLLWHEAKPNNRFIIIAALALGFAFLFRFQSLIFSFGLVLVLFLKRRLIFRHIMVGIIAFAVPFFIGILCDRWLYGNFVLTPLRYFYKTLFDNSSPTFGSMPWYFYCKEFLIYGIVPVSIALSLAFVYFLRVAWQNIISCAIVLFIAIHIFIPHKELRFLFPLVFCLPIILAEVLHRIPKLRIQNLVIAIFVVLNLPLLMYVTVRPAHTEIADIEYCNTHKDNTKIYYTLDNPAKIYGFYAIPSEEYLYHKLDSAQLAQTSFLQKGNLVFLTSYDTPKMNKSLLSKLSPIHARPNFEDFYFKSIFGINDTPSFSRTLYQLTN